MNFKGSQFERDIILWAVRWYVAYPISGGVPDVDMPLLKFWRINSLGTIASISRTPPTR